MRTRCGKGMQLCHILVFEADIWKTVLMISKMTSGLSIQMIILKVCYNILYFLLLLKHNINESCKRFLILLTILFCLFMFASIYVEILINCHAEEKKKSSDTTTVIHRL